MIKVVGFLDYANNVVRWNAVLMDDGCPVVVFSVMLLTMKTVWWGWWVGGCSSHKLIQGDGGPPKPVFLNVWQFDPCGWVGLKKADKFLTRRETLNGIFMAPYVFAKEHPLDDIVDGWGEI